MGEEDVLLKDFEDQEGRSRQYLSRIRMEQRMANDRVRKCRSIYASFHTEAEAKAYRIRLERDAVQEASNRRRELTESIYNSQVMSSFEATQSEEIQALQAIFFEEFEAISESTPISFNLKLAPSTDDGVVHVSIVLNVCFPTTYPDVKPDFSIISNIGLEEKQLNILRMIIDECASENIGMPMVFTVAERVKEWLLENNKPVTDGSAYAEMLNRQNQGTMKSNVSSSSRYNDPSIARKVVEVIDEEEELRRRRREEEPVTEEIFNEWQSAYIKEIEKMSVYDESLIGTVGRHPPGRLTGRQLFEMDSTLATSDTASSAGEMVVSVSLKDSALDEKTDEDDSDYDSDGGNSGDAAFFEDSD